MRKSTLASVLAIALLTSCTEEGDSSVTQPSKEKSLMGEVHSVPWLINDVNVAAFNQIWQLCEENPGVYKSHPNCVNMNEAVIQVNGNRSLDQQCLECYKYADANFCKSKFPYRDNFCVEIDMGGVDTPIDWQNHFKEKEYKTDPSKLVE